MIGTIGYSVMTVCLGSVLACTIYTASCPNSWVSRELGLDKSNPASSAIIKPHDAHAAAPNTAPAVRSEGVFTAIAQGMSREQVVAAIGEPSLTDSTNNQWTYGNEIVMFNGDFVIGCVKPDPMAAERLRNGVFANKMSYQSTATTGSARKSNRPWRSASSMHNRRPAYASGRTSGRSSLIIDYTPGISSMFNGNSYRQPEWLSAWSASRASQRRNSPAYRGSGGTYADPGQPRAYSSRY